MTDKPDPFLSVDEKLDLSKRTELVRTIHDSEEAARAIVNSSNFRSKAIVFIGTVILPISFSVLTAFYDEMPWQVFWLAFGSLTLVVFFLFRKIAVMQAPQNAFFMIKDLYLLSKSLRKSIGEYAKQNDEMRNRMASLDAAVEALSNALSRSAINLDRALSANVPDSSQQFSAMLSEILDPITQDLRHVFGITDAKVMLTLYLWDDSDKLLKISYRKKTSDKIKEKGRSWAKRKGFAGEVFGQKKTVVENGIGTPGNVKGVFSVEDTDKEYYRSAIGIPVIASNDEYDTPRDPLGVIVMTSSISGQFKDEIGTSNRYESALLAAARLAAIYLDFVDQQIDNEKEFQHVVFGGPDV